MASNPPQTESISPKEAESEAPAPVQQPQQQSTPQCAICRLNPAKYTCPSCSIKTCSVPCIKQHKTKTLCTGLVSPAQFLPAKELATPRALDRDYNFLTGIERKLGKSEDGQDGEGGKAERNLKHLWKVREVDVRRAPRGMKRRAEDESRIEYAGDQRHKRTRIVWTVEWVLPGGGRKIDSMSENMKLVEAFRKLEPRPEGFPEKGKLKFFLRKPFVAAAPGTVVVTTVDGVALLKDVLRGKSIDTFPTVYVFPEEAVELGDIVVDDDGTYQEKVLKDWKVRLGVEDEGEISEEDGEEKEEQNGKAPAGKAREKETDAWNVVDKALFSALERDLARGGTVVR